MARNDTPLFSAPRSRSLAVILGALVAAVVTTAGMPTYLPLVQTDSIGIPIVLFPLTWLLLFLFCAMSKSVTRVWLLLAVLTFVHAFLIYRALS